MAYYVRPMHQEDITQVIEADREAFPSQWPPPDYRHELRNRLAHYFVACDSDKIIDEPEIKATPERGPARLTARLGRLLRNYRSPNNESPSPDRHRIIGFVGFWVMADKAHIISIAVREAYRQQGIGELLLISTIDHATKLNVRIVTLEVRASNTAAQNLYTKYGFTKAGVRRGYYIDYGEDGIIMSTESITSATFRTNFQQLKQAHSSKQGTILSKATH